MILSGFHSTFTIPLNASLTELAGKLTVLGDRTIVAYNPANDSIETYYNDEWAYLMPAKRQVTYLYRDGVYEVPFTSPMGLPTRDRAFWQGSNPDLAVTNSGGVLNMPVQTSSLNYSSAARTSSRIDLSNYDTLTLKINGEYVNLDITSVNTPCYVCIGHYYGGGLFYSVCPSLASDTLFTSTTALAYDSTHPAAYTISEIYLQ